MKVTMSINLSSINNRKNYNNIKNKNN